MGTEVQRGTREISGRLPAPRLPLDGGKTLPVGQNLFDAYIYAERRTPNTLITIGPFVMNTFLQDLQTGSDVRAAVRGLATATFTTEQRRGGLREANKEHKERNVSVRGVTVESERSDRMVSQKIKVFTPDQLQRVYQEGVTNALNAIAVLDDADVDLTQGDRTESVIAFLESPRNLERTQAMFQAVADVLEEQKAIDVTEAYKIRITPSQGGHAPTERERQEVQETLIGMMSKPVLALANRLRFSEGQARRFMTVLTNPELSEEAA